MYFCKVAIVISTYHHQILTSHRGDGTNFGNSWRVNDGKFRQLQKALSNLLLI